DQAKTENVKAFWLEVDLEKSKKLSNAILEKKKTELKQKDMDIKLTRACRVCGGTFTGRERSAQIIKSSKIKFYRELERFYR
ncbi:1882_t:CDS:2, partial [Acaulospora colombiana]